MEAKKGQRMERGGDGDKKKTFLSGLKKVGKIA